MKMDLAKKRNCLRFVCLNGLLKEWDADYVLDLMDIYGDISKEDIFCMQEDRKRRSFDVTLKSEVKCLNFFDSWIKSCKFFERGEVFVSSFGSCKRMVISLEDPFVEISEVIKFFEKKEMTVKFEKDFLNSAGIWNGKRRFLIWTSNECNGFVPGKICINGKKGFCYWEVGTRVEKRKEVEIIESEGEEDFVKEEKVEVKRKEDFVVKPVRRYQVKKRDVVRVVVERRKDSVKYRLEEKGEDMVKERISSVDAEEVLFGDSFLELGLEDFWEKNFKKKVKEKG